MAYDRQFVSVDFIFAIAGTTEVAVTGINYSVSAGFASANAAVRELEAGVGVGPDCLDALETLMKNANLFWADYSHLKAVKFAPVGVAGAYVGEPFLYESEIDIFGGAANTLPQSTVVLSLRSGLTLGGGNYGRMYLPHTRLGMVAGTPATNAATTDVVVAAAATFVNGVGTALQGASTHELIPHIMSAKAGATSRTVAQVGIGTVTDTQRRRRAQLIETYSFASV